jgi:hypothetical protein
MKSLLLAALAPVLLAAVSLAAVLLAAVSLASVSLAPVSLVAVGLALPRGDPSPHADAAANEKTVAPAAASGELRSGELVPTADWFEEIFRSLRRDERERPPRRERDDRERWDDRGGGAERPSRPYFEDGNEESARIGGRYFRTVCVRLCDGFPIPLSFSTTRSRFAKEARRCEQTCPGGRLFVYRNPGGELEDMVDLEGRPYRELPTAFLHQSTYVQNCTCHGNPWDPEATARHAAYAAEAAQQLTDAPARKGKFGAEGRASRASRWVQRDIDDPEQR